MALLTTLVSKRSGNGNSLAGVQAGASDTFVNTGKEIVVIVNGSASPVTATFTTAVTVDGLAVADLTATIPAGATHAVGPFPPGWYNADLANGGLVTVTMSDPTDVDIAVLSVAQV